MSMSSPPREGDKSQPGIFCYADARWEFMPAAEEIIRSRSDWRFETLRDEFTDVLIKNKPARIVFVMETAAGKAGIKALLFDEFAVRLRSLFGRCRTRREWENHLTAVSCCVPTVRPLALAEFRRNALVQQAVIITEWRENAVPLSDWRRTRAENAGDSAALRLAADIGRMAALTHGTGLYHNEIMPSNLLVENPDGEQRLLLIDWKHARVKPHTLANDVQNLLRLGRLFDHNLAYTPPTDGEKQAFLSAYVDALPNDSDRVRLRAELKRLCSDSSWI